MNIRKMPLTHYDTALHYMPYYVKLVILCVALWGIISLKLGFTQPLEGAVLTYNVENLFNPGEPTSVNPDTSFMPYGDKHWTKKRLRAKCVQIARNMIASCGHVPILLVGLCEIEDSVVLEQLIRWTPLARYPYRFVHRDSPDSRGIDVAILYRSDLLTLLHAQWLTVPPYGTPPRTTREMLYCRFLVPSQDTLHVVQCHWPSNFGGVVAGGKHRKEALKVLQQVTDSIQHVNAEAKLIVMGDFNTTIDDAIFNDFSTFDHSLARERHLLVNTSGESSSTALPRYTYKFQGKWQSIDLCFVSIGLYSKRGLRVQPTPEEVPVPLHMLESDDQYGGLRPTRCYRGPIYAGGVSDHLPLRIILDC